jgi:hypothetical protein
MFNLSGQTAAKKNRALNEFFSALGDMPQI